jgi:4-hydroxy-tetrahydrodipicolinate reductase
MQLLIFGRGRLGGAIADHAVAAGWPAPHLVGRPPDGGHLQRSLPGADAVVDASRGQAVADNLAAALEAGHRAFVLAATGWEDDEPRVATLLARHGGAAVVAPNLSLGAALFGRLVEQAAAWYAIADGFEPFLVEWHRRGKADRPSGTARALARRIVAADPRYAEARDEDEGGPPGRRGLRDERGRPVDRRPTDDRRRSLEIVAIRAGSSPGMHAVGFDAPGETVELRLTARDRSAYAAGALAAVRWLCRESRAPGLHPFDVVVDDLLETRPATAAA